ncbi:hypothetical protein [Halovivax cerinus]|uniref:Lipid A biosynthesis N-terminal domain-containing protein n=1 Tax=Halovivax cerinus TaxID=1487865 RepID=A0ABD5NJV8_9EURY|nr:hypothetical protein [Halovivax cerinus]
MVSVPGAIGLAGGLASIGAFAVTRRDAERVGVSRPLLWALATSGTLAVGVFLYLFTSAPLPGVIMTANTGAVLYGFERELTRRDDQPARPGRLPFEPQTEAPTDSDHGSSADGHPTRDRDDVGDQR